MYQTRTRKLRALLIGAVALCTVTGTQAATLKGVEMPDSVNVGGTELVLNGMGMRLATFFKIKVYVLGFYLPQSSADATAILESDAPKRIMMHFLRDVGADDLQEAWQEGYENNGADMTALGDQISQFKAAMTGVTEGQQMVVDFTADRVTVALDGKQLADISAPGFGRATLAIWLGPEPPNSELKQGMLGG